MTVLFQKFVDIIKALRAPNGCPWDKEQTLESLTPHIIEEAYELVAAMKAKDYDNLKEELGDVLLHVVMISNMCEEENVFTEYDVIQSIQEKMIRRHPHVFGESKASTIDEVWKNWEAIKKDEKKETSMLGTVLPSLPALMETQKIQSKLTRAGAAHLLSVPTIEPTSSLLTKELFGQKLFALVAEAKANGIDAEDALKEVNHTFKQRFMELEKKAKETNKPLSEWSASELNLLWRQVQ